MKCFVVLPVILAVGLGYSPPETAEVVAAKQEFFRAYQQQLAAASASSPNARFNGASAPAAPPVSYESYAPAAPAAQPVSYAAQGGAPNYNDGLTYPEAEPYVHQEPAYDPSSETYTPRRYSQGAPAAPAPSRSYAPAPAAQTYAPAPQSYAPAAPAQLAYPAVPANVPAQSYAPAAPAASYGGGQLAGHLAGQGAGLNYDSRVWNNQCYNNLGNGVECRKLGGNPQY